MKYLCTLSADVANPQFRPDCMYPFNWMNVPVFKAGTKYVLTTWDEPEPGAHLTQWGETAHTSPTVTALLQPHLKQDVSLTALLISHSIGPQPRGMEHAALQVLFLLVDTGQISLEDVYAAAFAIHGLSPSETAEIQRRLGMQDEWTLRKTLRKAIAQDADE